MRRRQRGAPVTLFSFLDILAAAVGTLVLIIAAMLALSLPEIAQIVEPAPEGSHREPAFVECTENGLLLHPELVEVPTRTIRTNDDWRQLLERLEGDSAQRYLILLVRPGGIASFRLAETMAAARSLEVGYEPIYAAGPVELREFETEQGL